MRGSTPGLGWRRRNEVVAYWTCSAKLAKAGYPIKTRRLWSGPLGSEPNAEEMAAIAEQCKQLQHEMLDWSLRPRARLRLRVQRKSGYVYFVQLDDMIKIGFAVEPKKRIRALQIGTPHELKILAMFEGNPRLEAQIHARFARLRHKGEWFKAGPALLKFIEEGVRQSFF